MALQYSSQLQVGSSSAASHAGYTLPPPTSMRPTSLGTLVQASRAQSVTTPTTPLSRNDNHSSARLRVTTRPSASAPSPAQGAETQRQVSRPTLLIENFVTTFRLSSSQAKELYGLYEVATSLPGDLSMADIMSRVYSLACLLARENRILYAISAGSSAADQGGISSGELKRIALEIKTMLDDGWKVTSQQKTIVRRVAKEQIYKATRTSFKSLFGDVNRILRGKPELYRMSNIYGHAQREKLLSSVIKTQVSAVRNTFRSEILDSVVGKKACSLDEFTVTCSTKYLADAVMTPAQNQGYTVHNVLLRRFAWENTELFKLPNESTDNVESGDEEHEPSSHKRKKFGRGSGRIAVGEDFWSKVDTWFEKGVELCGADLTSSEWQRFINESLEADNARYQSRLLPHQLRVNGTLNNSTSIEETPTTETSAPSSQNSSEQEDSTMGSPGLLSHLRLFLHGPVDDSFDHNTFQGHHNHADDWDGTQAPSQFSPIADYHPTGPALGTRLNVRHSTSPSP
ncbi:hypothetical protein D9613_012185 [Agrocybe pediades]|uniref:Uncharacterized protein n=1 Tax=Agrocybe pediades TaxID=84607 RepID=A0A8H4R2Z9_9AGAR|nr:hypothetical protein D9613_012185 [Agrocybe pediades]